MTHKQETEHALNALNYGAQQQVYGLAMGLAELLDVAEREAALSISGLARRLAEADTRAGTLQGEITEVGNQRDDIKREHARICIEVKELREGKRYAEMALELVREACSEAGHSAEGLVAPLGQCPASQAVRNLTKDRNEWREVAEQYRKERDGSRKAHADTLNAMSDGSAQAGREVDALQRELRKVKDNNNVRGVVIDTARNALADAGFPTMFPPDGSLADAIRRLSADRNECATAAGKLRQSLAKVTGTIPANNRIYIQACGYCGQEHTDLERQPIPLPHVGDWTHWAVCPVKGAPILCGGSSGTSYVPTLPAPVFAEMLKNLPDAGKKCNPESTTALEYCDDGLWVPCKVWSDPRDASGFGAWILLGGGTNKPFDLNKLRVKPIL